MDEVRIGVIGCGSMGRGLTRQAATLGGVTIVAGADPRDDSLNAFAAEHPSAATHGDHRGLLERQDMDAVIVATAPHLHCAHAIDSAAAGKHIFCEKPMATNVADCERMIQAAENAKVTLMIGQVLRFYPCWATVIKRVRAGDLGEPLAAQVTRIQGSLAKAGGWRANFKTSGGMLLEINAHELDFMRCICGEAQSVFALANTYCDPAESGPDLYFVSINYESGTIGLLHSSQCSAIGDLSGKIQCRHGTIRYQDGFAADGVIEVKQFNGDGERLRIGDIEAGNPVRHEMRLFVESLRAEAPSPIPGVDGKRVVELGQAAYLSAQLGEPVALPLTEGVDITD